MKKDIKVELTASWWNTNKAKTLIDRGDLGKALAAFEPAYQLASVATGPELLSRVTTALHACDALDRAAASTASACAGPIHADTAAVLKTSFPAEVARHRTALNKKLQDFKTMVNGLKLVNILADRALRAQFMQFAIENHSSENTDFLITKADHKDAGTYNEFIREGASRQVNIDAPLRRKFDEAVKKGDIAHAPWDEARKAVADMLELDTVPKFRKKLTG